MTEQFQILFYGTGMMLLIAIMFIILVAWVSKKLSDQNKKIDSRDKRWMDRVEGIESLVRTEFAEVLNQLKKL